MRQVRNNVFETNSSSTHSIAICTEEQFRDWTDGKLLYDDWYCKFAEEPQLTDDDYDDAKDVYNSCKGKFYKDWEDLSDDERTDYTRDCVNKKRTKEKYTNYMSKDDWYHAHGNVEHYVEHFTTPSGDKMVAFGYYGYDG